MECYLTGGSNVSTQLNNFINVLEEMFQFDQADLDFGIYRIMNQKRKEVNRFLNKDLIPQVKKAFEKYKDADIETIKEQINKLEKQLVDMGVAKESSEKYVTLQNKLNQGVDIVALENEVFSDLTNFFKRYYHEGDFLSLRRYKKDIYSIPYEGEEVKLHWANADQYYVKSSEHFRDYTFTLSSGKKVHFKLIDANTEQHNNKAQEGKERRFILANTDPLVEENGELTIKFEYRPDGEKRTREKINDETVERIFSIEEFDSWIPDLQVLSPSEKNKKRTLLEKHLNDYTARNTFDYFIHKDLGGFLRRELDFFIKNEIIHLDDLDTENEKRFEQYLSKVRVIKLIGHKIIDFLQQIEEFQKNLWLKKKFVIEANYCLTLDKVPEEFYKEILKNNAQIEEWKKLFFIEDIKSSTVASGFTEPLTVSFLKENPYLTIDTKYFTNTFKRKLLSSIDDIDKVCDGLMIKSDNFHALNLIDTKYRESIGSIYIDPPYNTSASEIIYKNSFKHSSWLSLIENRLRVASNLLADEGILCITIDDFEYHRLSNVVENIFGIDNILGRAIIRNNPSGRSTAKGFSIAHEYGIFVSKSENAKVGRLQRTDEQQARYDEKDEIGYFEWVNFRKHGGTRDESPKMFYPIYLTENSLRIPPMEWNEVKRDWDVFEKPLPNEMVAYPIDNNGKERRWKWGLERILENIDEFSVRKDRSGNPAVYMKARVNDEGVLPLTWWDKKEYSATAYGTNLVKNIFGELNTFSYPKSIHAVEDALRVTSLKKDGTVLDFFGGSGTTGHAVINLNREDNGKRKYILVEMGEHFDTALKPRIQKIIYSKDWKDGKPLTREGSSHIFKYIHLESYEDALNNIDLHLSEQQKLAIEENMTPSARENYMLSYMLNVESEGSASLLNIDMFKNPFDYKMKISNGTETKIQKIDLVETFNYLIGLHVKEMDYIKGFQLIKGELSTGENVLVIWRNLNDSTNEELDEFLKTLNINSRDFEYDRIYINGDNHIENLKIDESNWKVVLIEEEFKRLMFDVQDV